MTSPVHAAVADDATPPLDSCGEEEEFVHHIKSVQVSASTAAQDADCVNWCLSVSIHHHQHHPFAAMFKPRSGGGGGFFGGLWKPKNPHSLEHLK